MDIFSNREIATYIWLLAFTAFVFINKNMRPSAINVVVVFCSRALVSIYILLGLYVFSAVYVLSSFGLWDLSQLKNTVLWTITVALFSIFQIAWNKKDEPATKALLIDNIKALAILEFVVAFYDLHLLLELIIIPVATLLVLVSAQAERKPETLPAKKVADFFLAVIGISMIFHAISQLFADFSLFFSKGTLVEFYVPPLLSLFFIPFAVFMSIYLTYERIFSMLKIPIKDEEVRRYAKSRAFLAFHFRLNLLERWHQSLFNFQSPSFEDIKTSILEVLEMKKAERLNKKVPPEQGWSPYDAMEYLSEFGISAENYHRMGNEYFSNSKPLKLHGYPIENSISYFVDGSKEAANRLKVRLDVSQPEEDEEDLALFYEIAETLYLKACNHNMPPNIKECLVSGHDIECVSESSHKVLIKKDDWRPNAYESYDIKLEITKQD